MRSASLNFATKTFLLSYPIPGLVSNSKKKIPSALVWTGKTRRKPMVSLHLIVLFSLHRQRNSNKTRDHTTKNQNRAHICKDAIYPLLNFFSQWGTLKLLKQLISSLVSSIRNICHHWAVICPSPRLLPIAPDSNTQQSLSHPQQDISFNIWRWVKHLCIPTCTQSYHLLHTNKTPALCTEPHHPPSHLILTVILYKIYDEY